MRPVFRMLVLLLVFAISFTTMANFSSATGAEIATPSLQSTELECEGQQCLLPTSYQNKSETIKNSHPEQLAQDEKKVETTDDTQDEKSIFK